MEQREESSSDIFSVSVQTVWDSRQFAFRRDDAVISLVCSTSDLVVSHPERLGEKEELVRVHNGVLFLKLWLAGRRVVNTTILRRPEFQTLKEREQVQM